MIVTSWLLYPLRFHIIFHYDVMSSIQGEKGSKGEKGPEVQVLPSNYSFYSNRTIRHITTYIKLFQ